MITVGTQLSFSLINVREGLCSNVIQETVLEQEFMPKMHYYYENIVKLL